MQLIAVLVTLAAVSTAPRSGVSLTHSADSLVSAYAQSAKFSGDVLVARHGRVAFEHAYGKANLEWNVANTVETRFEIASLTKAFTGMAIAQLAAAGKLGLDDPIAKDYPAAPVAWKDITVEELLTHMSGLPSNDLKDFTKGIAVPYTSDELIATFRDRPLANPPGTHWQYTNTEYYLLAELIEKFSGEDYGTYLARHIFTPLGMSHSGFAPTTAVIPHMAEGYARDSSGFRHRDYFDRSLEIGAGGVHSTLHDLLAWDQALYGNKLVPADYLARVFAAKNQGDYGYGWFVTHDKRGVRHWHEGSDPGFAAFIIRRPEQGLLVVVLANVEDAPVREIAGKLEDLALTP
jgi:CubicO group peptidase (beta-lactamase class C family)